ncbi:hypothetical protein KSD_50720 [Ktedonobacter sp. SOSP1-85]|nr:hypothetical protein KSD_50720 [Ktedonobacter sp. SOSP1-85]
MSQTLQFARELFSDEGLVSLKEWNGPNGAMGMYHAKDVGYIYLLVYIQGPTTPLYASVPRYRENPGAS